VLFTGLLLPPILTVIGAGFVVDLARRGRRVIEEQAGQTLSRKLVTLLERLELSLVPLGIAGLGVLLYLYWQTGPALLPGKNSTIKFVYVASLFGPTIALLFTRRLKVAAFNLLTCYFLILFVVALPVAMFWPS
jgi:hypothetical protein